MFSVTFKAFVIFVTLSLFQSNFYVVLASGKGPKNSIRRSFQDKQIINKKIPEPQLSFTCLMVCG